MEGSGGRDPRRPAARLPGDGSCGAVGAPRAGGQRPGCLPATVANRQIRSRCSTSIWSAPDGSGLLTSGASSVQTDPEGSCRIVWMINRDDQAVRRAPSVTQTTAGIVQRAPDIRSGDGWSTGARAAVTTDLNQTSRSALLSRTGSMWRHRHGGVDQPGRLGPRTRPVSRARAAASRARPSTTMSESPVPLISSRLSCMATRARVLRAAGGCCGAGASSRGSPGVGWSPLRGWVAIAGRWSGRWPGCWPTGV